jgi:hypothetical protein
MPGLARGQQKRKRTHPITETIRHAAYLGERALPSKEELDTLQLSPAMRAKVLRACVDVAEIHDNGIKSEAWAAADEAAAGIIDELPLDLQDPDYTRAEDLSKLGPLELADRVRARGPMRVA